MQDRTEKETADRLLTAIAVYVKQKSPTAKATNNTLQISFPQGGTHSIRDMPPTQIATTSIQFR